jgi:hypothetical protein
MAVIELMKSFTNKGHQTTQRLHLVAAVLSWAVLFATMGGLAGGCSSPARSSSAPKPGSGIAEYRALTRDAHRAVADTVKSLEALAQPQAQPSTPHPALPRFDRSVQELEVTSFKTRSRAEAIMARGEAYFDEWKAHLAGISNQATARVETERYTRLHDQFRLVRERSGEVRTEFRPFMNGLREFRATLDKSPDSVGGEPSRRTIDTLSADGRRVLGRLDALSKTLDDAEVELRATLASKR